MGANNYTNIGNLLVAVGGDLITAIDGKKVGSMDELNELMDGFKVGQVISLDFLRSGQARKIKVTLEEMPRVQNPLFPVP